MNEYNFLNIVECDKRWLICDLRWKLQNLYIVFKTMQNIKNDKRFSANYEIIFDIPTPPELRYSIIHMSVPRYFKIGLRRVFFSFQAVRTIFFTAMLRT